MHFLPGYILVSHGPRYSNSVEELPGAQTQFLSLEKQAARGNAQLRIMGHDYARKIRSSDDLPNLFRLLKVLQQDAEKTGLPARLMIDDYARLFRAADEAFRPELWDRLLDYSDHIRDLRQGRPLNELSQEMSMLIRNGVLPPLKRRTPNKDRSEQERAAQTARARHISAKARSTSAQQAAAALQQAYSKHIANAPGTSFREFLESPGAEGLKNSQGKPWTYRTGLRAIRELKSEKG